MAARSAPSSRAPGAAEFRAPLTVPGGEVAGAEVVRELPTAFALPVWQALRSVLRWAAALPGARAGLFDAGAMVGWEVELLEGEWEEAVRLPVAVIAGTLADGERASPERLARASLCVADWALAHGAVSTGLAFAEAAALAWPEQPRYAYTAGRLLRAYGRPREAETWMRRVVRVGRMLGDWNVQALGLHALGNTFTQLGDFRGATNYLLRALQINRRNRLFEGEGEILHDLFVATWSAGRTEIAERYAREALECYRHGHERLPALAHDVAFAWIGQGYHRRALIVLETLPGYFVVPQERIRVLASIARAAGGCGDRETFDGAATEIYKMIADESSPAGDLAAPLVELAIGAASLEFWDTAEAALLSAVRVARQHEDSNTLIRAEEALARVRCREPLETAWHQREGDRSVVIDSLAADFRRSLLSENFAVVS